jgi:hypothetical protein
MTRIGSAGFTAVTSPVVSSSSTTVPFCGVLWLKSNMLPSVPAMLSKEPPPMRSPERKVSSINRTMEVWSVRVESMQFFFSQREIASSGRRGPYEGVYTNAFRNPSHRLARTNPCSDAIS